MLELALGLALIFVLHQILVYKVCSHLIVRVAEVKAKNQGKITFLSI